LAGTFDIGMYEYDNSIIFMPLPRRSSSFKLPDAVSSLEIFVDDPDKTRDEIRAIRGLVGDGVRIIDWQQANSSYFTAVMVERNVMFLILTLIIVVAPSHHLEHDHDGEDKGRDIASCAHGRDARMILRIFILSGASIGVIGTVAGFALGLSIANNIEAIRQVVQSISGVDPSTRRSTSCRSCRPRSTRCKLALVVVMALSLSLLATIYPSWRAARLDRWKRCAMNNARPHEGTHRERYAAGARAAHRRPHLSSGGQHPRGLAAPR